MFPFSLIIVYQKDYQLVITLKPWGNIEHSGNNLTISTFENWAIHPAWNNMYHNLEKILILAVTWSSTKLIIESLINTAVLE